MIAHYVAVGGDLNIDFNRDSKLESFAILESFMDEHKHILRQFDVMSK